MAEKIDARLLWEGYRQVVGQYPNIPPMAFWRPWEIALFKDRLPFKEGSLLDLACGDGRFAQIVLKDYSGRMVGSDFIPDLVRTASQCGVYRATLVSDGRKLPFRDASFDHVFSNSALEHFDDLDLALSEVARVLKPGGNFVFTAVTDKFVGWQPLSGLSKILGFGERIRKVSEAHVRYHNLKNPFPLERWAERVERHGFEVLQAREYLGYCITKVFLAMDQLWHANGDRLGTRYVQKHDKDKKLPFYFDALYAACVWLDRFSTRGAGILVMARKRA